MQSGLNIDSNVLPHTNRMRIDEVMAIQSLLSNVISHIRARERQKLFHNGRHHAVFVVVVDGHRQLMALLGLAMKIKASSFIINV